jgi:thiamine biosynthesis protein ThiS
MTGTVQKVEKTGSPRPIDRPIAVTVNGSAREVTGSLSDLLESLSLDARSVVVEHNGTILRDRASLPSIALAEGDVVEIVHFVGGG